LEGITSLQQPLLSVIPLFRQDKFPSIRLFPQKNEPFPLWTKQMQNVINKQKRHLFSLTQVQASPLTGRESS